MPDYLFKYREKELVDSSKFKPALHSNKYNIEREEMQLNTLKYMISMRDNNRAFKMCQSIEGLYNLVRSGNADPTENQDDKATEEYVGYRRSVAKKGWKLEHGKRWM
jgi:hypothetical protein